MELGTRELLYVGVYKIWLVGEMIWWVSVVLYRFDPPMLFLLRVVYVVLKIWLVFMTFHFPIPKSKG